MHRLNNSFQQLLILVLLAVVGCEAKLKQPETLSDSTSSEVAKPAEPMQSLAKVTVDAYLEAALEGDVAIVKLARSQGLAVDAKGEDDRTALMLAAFNGHTAIVEYLIAEGAEIDARDNIQRTALMYASTLPNVATVQRLLDAKAEINAIDSGEHWTPLMFAAGEGHTAVCKLLLDQGADASMTDIDGESALDFAQRRGHRETTMLLGQNK